MVNKEKYHFKVCIVLGEITPSLNTREGETGGGSFPSPFKERGMGGEVKSPLFLRERGDDRGESEKKLRK